MFEVDYAEIARALDKGEAACRQLVHRARAQVREGRRRFVADEDERRQLLERFIEAIRADDQRALLALLAPDAALVSDGGGKVRAARNVIHGADRIARFLLGVARKQAGRFADQIAIINSEPGVVRRLDGQISATISIALEPEGISAVYVVLNPDKLRRIAGSVAPAGSGTRP